MRNFTFTPALTNKRFCLVLVFLLLATLSGKSEGTKQLNTNNVESTALYLCNDFAGHCTSLNGDRSQFATYNDDQSADDVDRLYFVTTSSAEAVYLGFKGGGITSARHIDYRIKDFAGNIVFTETPLPTSGTGFISTFTQAVNGPNQLILPPSPANGFNAKSFHPPVPGTYFIEFTVRNTNGTLYVGTFDLSLFDITVADTVAKLAKPGRVYSKSWQFSADQTDHFYGKTYIISDDSIVTSAQFSNTNGGAWVQYCNQTGCGNSTSNWMISRKSIYLQQALFPQFKIFLNRPDSILFPSASTLGQIVDPQPFGVRNCLTGHILFHVNVDKPGNAEITLTFPPPYQPRPLNQPVVVGENLFDWDGLDGTLPIGMVVPNNTLIQFTVKYINGLTNLPLYDVEGNTNGFTIALVSPAGATPAVFWDDSNIPAGTINSTLPGCTSPPGCHSWSSSGSGWGNKNTVNTWWYNVSTTTTPPPIVEFRGPQDLQILQLPSAFCANSGYQGFSVTPDDNTDVYHWSYRPSADVTITTPTASSVTVNFGPMAQSGYLKVYGSNTNCAMNSQPDSIAITINPLPAPTLSGLPSTCVDQTNNIYATEPGKVGYQWVFSPGANITAGGNNLSNTATVTWLTAGAKTVTVNYLNPGSSCVAVAPAIVNVTVNPPPIVSLDGLSPVCVETGGLVYTTNPGKLFYEWTVSAGGEIQSGGGSGNNTVTIIWHNTGPQFVNVRFTDPATGCVPTNPTQFNVTVNNLPTPVFLTYSNSVCQGATGVIYTTESGMSNYEWSITGGTINLGGQPTDDWASVTWNTVGNQSIGVNYTYPSSSCTGPTPTILPVTVKPLPVASIISDKNSVCLNVPGNTYNTQPGMLAYNWSAIGGTILSGGGPFDDFATVTWNLVGSRNVAVNYMDPVTHCTAAAAATFPVAVKPLPEPTFVSGADSVCLNIPGHVYATQSGMEDYSWAITGGEIKTGGGSADHSATVTWNTVGNQSISVIYTDPATQCRAASPIVFPVYVKPLPVPSFISGNNPVCQGSQGTVYKTQPGMTGYTWSITGGTITNVLTSTSDSAVVTWNVVGNQSIGISYTNPATQCTSAASIPFAVTVKVLPVPAITGPGAACVNTAGPVYYTEPGMSGYQWITPNGTITPGVTPDTIHVIWNTIGTHTMSVKYTATNGCEPATPTQKTVQVNSLPVPGLNGRNVICTGVPTTYATENGMQDYVWGLTTGANIISGGSSSENFVTLKWMTPGNHQVSVNYSLGTGCTAASPKTLAVTVNQSTPPVIQENPAGQNCVTFSTAYSTQSGMSGYTWSVSPGGNIVSSSTANTIQVKWNAAGTQWVRTNFTNLFGCTADTATQLDVMVNPLPDPTITSASGNDCESMPHLYQVPVNNACTFNWTIDPISRGLITTGQGSNAVSINWQSYGTAIVSVLGTNNSTGCYAASTFTTTVYPKPNPVFTPCFDQVTTPGAKPIVLKGSAPFVAGQGIFSGVRVSRNLSTGFYEFNPLNATAGDYPISYTYTNMYGCPSTPPPVTISVQNNPFTCGSDLTDVRDGKKYPTTFIGGKCWMAKNLDYGAIISDNKLALDNCIDEKYCQPGDNNCTAFGGLYQWEEMMRYGHTSANQGICPPEWRVPSESEWQVLLLSLGTGVNPPDGISGGFLKEKSLNGKIHALLTGIYYDNHTWAFTSGNLTGTMFWTNTTPTGDRAIARGLNQPNPSTSLYNGSRENAFSVRCIKD